MKTQFLYSLKKGAIFNYPNCQHKIFTLLHLVNGIPNLCQNNLSTEMIKRSAEKFKIMQICLKCFFYICLALTDLAMNSSAGPIDLFKPTVFLCLSNARTQTQISIVFCGCNFFRLPFSGVVRVLVCLYSSPLLLQLIFF